MMRLSLYFFLWMLSIAIAIFAGQNTYLVNLKFFSFESVKLPLGVVLVFSAGLGAIFVNFWQGSISFDTPTMPKFSGFVDQNSPSKNQFTTKTSDVKKDIPRKTKKPKDDFGEDWDEDWG